MDSIQTPLGPHLRIALGAEDSCTEADGASDIDNLQGVPKRVER